MNRCAALNISLAPELVALAVARVTPDRSGTANKVLRAILRCLEQELAGQAARLPAQTA